MMIALTLIFTSCQKEDGVDPNATYEVTFQLVYPNDAATAAGVTVKLESSLGTILEAETTEDGLVTFEAITGSYTASASEQRADDGTAKLYNGTSSTILVTSSWDSEVVTDITLLESTSNQVVIKEFYFAGCQNNTGESDYTYDKYVTLYNNSAVEARLNNMCIGTSAGNAHSPCDRDDSGELSFKDESYCPLWSMIAVMENEVVIPAYGEITIALNGGIDHTVTYTNSVDLSDADYVIYDPEILTSTSYHPVPSATISVDNYLKINRYGSGTGFVLGNICPTIVIFQMPEGMSIYEYTADADNIHYPVKYQLAAFACAKIEKEWIIDAVETYSANYVTESVKRLTDDIDAGYIFITQRQGYTAYRNVDVDATTAIEGNTEKLVYGYTGGTDGVVETGTTDSSGIDAEASIANGAVIIYQDYNNTTKDFHQRKVSALK